MAATLPHSVAVAQPLSVGKSDYRIRVDLRARKRLSDRVVEYASIRLGDPALTAAKCVTALVKMGIQTGNAQRILDGKSDVRIGTVADVAKKLGVSLADLLSEDPADADKAAAPWPFQRLPQSQWADINDRERGAIEDAAVSKWRELQAEKAAASERPVGKRRA